MLSIQFQDVFRRTVTAKKFGSMFNISKFQIKYIHMNCVSITTASLGEGKLVAVVIPGVGGSQSPRHSASSGCG